MEERTFDFRTARKNFSRLGWSLGITLVLGIVAQFTLVFLLPSMGSLGQWLMFSSTGMWIVTFAPVYLIAVPVGILLLRRIPGSAPGEMKLGGKDFLVLLPIAMCLMYGGNLLGNILSGILSGGSATNALLDYAMDNHPLKIVVMVILAPVLEEYIFRKLLIDRTRQYGEKTAVLLSAAAFGLFHMNLFQFFYAFALGWLFAYVYIRTGRLRYSVILHGIINFMGSVLAPALLSMLDMEALATLDPNAAPGELLAVYGQMLPGLLTYLGYALFLMGMSIAGLALILTRYKKLLWLPGENQLPEGTAGKTVYGNAGMIVYMAVCLVFTGLALL